MSPEVEVLQSKNSSTSSLLQRMSLYYVLASVPVEQSFRLSVIAKTTLSSKILGLIRLKWLDLCSRLSKIVSKIIYFKSIVK